LPFRSDKFGSVGRKNRNRGSFRNFRWLIGKVNSPVSIKPTKGSIVKELDEIMEILDLEESSGIWAPTITSTNQAAIQKRISWPVMAMSPAILKIHGGQVIWARRRR
jgi:hypothetical protein